MKFNLTLFSILALGILAMSNVSASYWIDGNNNLWISKTIPSGSSITFDLTEATGFSPNGNAVFPTFFEDFESDSTIQYDYIVTQKTCLLTGATDVPLVMHNNKIYATSAYGSSSSIILNNEQIYDLANNSWT